MSDPSLHMHMRPQPDPTELTTAMLQREIATLKEMIATENKLHREVIREQFNGVDQRFTERDTRTDQTARNDKVNLDAAFAAAKEAVGEQNKSSALAIAKSEAATTKQIDQVGSQLIGANSSLTDKIDDTKIRLNILEGRLNLIAGRDTGVGLSVATMVQIFTSLSALAAIITFLIAHK